MALTGSERGDVWIFPTGQDLPLPALLFHPPPDPPPSSYLCTFFSIVQINIRILKYALYFCILAPDIEPCFNFCIKLYCAFYFCIVSFLRIVMFCSTTQLFHIWAQLQWNRNIKKRTLPFSFKFVLLTVWSPQQCFRVVESEVEYRDILPHLTWYLYTLFQSIPSVWPPLMSGITHPHAWPVQLHCPILLSW